METSSPRPGAPTPTPLSRVRAAHLCARMGGGLVETEDALSLLLEREEDLDALSPALLEAGCRDAVSELLVRLVHDGGRTRHRGRNLLAALWIEDVTRWCRWMCHSAQPAADIAQEVLVVLITDVDRVRDPSQLRRWLHSVAWRKVRAHRRRAWWRLRAPEEPAEAVLRAVEGPERVERLLAMERVLDQVSAEGRRLLWLVYVEGRTRRDAARLLGLAEGTLNRKLTRARRDFEAAATRRGLAPALDSGGLP